jgi:metallo-beta-lactamase class B
MIDTGVAEEEAQYFANIQRVGVNPADLFAILHTHNHPDHTGTTASLVAASGAETMMGEEDAAQFAVECILRDKDELEFAETRLTFIHTPGHTRGCGLYLGEYGGRRICFMGDAGGPFIFEQVRWEGDAEAFRTSAERMKKVVADIYLPGHPHQILEVSADGDPRLNQEQWHHYIDSRVRKMEAIISAPRG